MNVLITGNLTSLTIALVNEFSKRKHRLVLASDDADRLGIRSNSIVVHSINPAGDIFRDAISSYGFDIVIYLSTREEQLYDERDFNTGHHLDGLRNTLELCKNGMPKHFFYISSTEVYGKMDDLSESTTPQPSSLNGYTLLAGEEYCRTYHNQFGVKITILRLTNIYGPDEKSGLVYNLILACNRKSEVSIPSREDREISLLHVLDVTDFLVRIIDEDYAPESLVVNLSSSKPIKFSELARLLGTHFPNVTMNFLEKEEIYTQPAIVSVARGLYDWTDSHTLENELESVIESIGVDHQPEKSWLGNVTEKLSNYPELLKWIELIGGTVLVQYLSEITGTLIQFKYIDFRLLFVVIMGSIYGLRTGLYAATLMSLSILYTWWQLGFDWALLTYNVGNWLPFALYFTAGLITGYYHDKSESEILNAKKQTGLIYDKYSFLYSVFNDIRNLKDVFRERLLGYRDSYGKIFAVTLELDQLQEQAIYLRALNILEEHTENNNIAIYSLNGEGDYARLEASSISFNGSLTKSLNLANFPELQSHIEKGIIFQNTALLPDYPAYMVPVFNNAYPFNVPTAIIMIWSVKFEQYSTYYYNRLKVICGLIQASLVRANLFTNVNYERMHLPATRILNNESFMEALKIREEMKKNKVYDFQIVAIESTKNQQDIYSHISESIRANDLIGMGDDGNYYILLSQADKTTAQDILDRLASFGIQSKLVDTNQLPQLI